jgi:hypothetical protein
MANDRLYRFASRKVTTWSRTQLPGYWTVLQVLAGAGFAVFIAVQLIGGGPAPAGEQAPPVLSLPRTEGTAPAAPVEPAAPVDPATPSTAVPADATVDLPGAAGQPVTVPQAVADLASLALRAQYDPDLAGQVPTAGGGTLPGPTQAFPGATVGPLTVVMAADGRYALAAPTDADGEGSQYNAVTSTVTIVRDGDGWAVEIL